MRGWWGDPWGFESPLRHHSILIEALSDKLSAFLVSNGALRGLEPALGADRKGRKRATLGARKPGAAPPKAEA